MKINFTNHSFIPDDIIVIAVIRNEILRLPWFLNYHRKLGVSKFIIIDNGSTDDTVAFLRDQPDVNIAITYESYAQSYCGVQWTNLILNEFCIGNWVLVVDADELFVYPHCETVNIHELAAYLDQNNSQAVAAPLLDLYSKGPILETAYVQGKPFQDYCQFFDSDTYHKKTIVGTNFDAIYRGGPRHRLFWHDKNLDHPSPLLFKIPFIKWCNDFSLEASTHILKGAKLSSLTGILMHFKFLQDFKKNANQEILRKEHFCEARQYAAYARGFENNENLTAYYSGSVLYEGTHQLINMGFINKPPDFP